MAIFEQPLILYVTFVVQATGAFLTAAVFFSFYGHYRKSHLLHWTRSWFALGVYLLFGAIAIGLAPAYPSSHPARLGAAIVSAVAGYVQLAWLLFGVYELAMTKIVPRVLVTRTTAALVVFAVAATTLFAWDPGAGDARFILRVAVRAGLVGIAFFFATYAIVRSCGIRCGLGPRLVGVAFLGYGFEQLHIFASAAMALTRGQSLPWVQYLGFVDFLLQFAMALGLVIWLLEDERKASVHASAQIEHLAYHDALTGLPNRQLFLDRLDLAIANAHRNGHQLAVLFFDLDRFKVINDSLGHSAGDTLLRFVAQRVSTLLRENDTLARIGGDEFVLLAPQVNHVEDAVTIARKVRETVKGAMMVSGRELFVSTSLGISLYPDDGSDAETLLKNADIAMYRAKAQGRDTFQLYTRAMNARALEQLALENRLRRAVEGDELVLHFQPILDLDPEQVDAVEALVRWQHPELGLLYPEEFVSIAEATGLIVPIGEWVLRSACRLMKAWHDRGHASLRVACNLSVRQIQQPDVVARVAGILAETGLPAQALELEITETIAMHSGDGMVEKLRALRRLGVRFSIDDFGTGYSSLSALRLLPVDTLKIDRSFVSSHGEAASDAAIPAAVIALAHSLGLTVVAEGVETDAQHALLREQRCDAWQGYLACAPVAAVECLAYLDAHAARHARRPVVLPAAFAPVIVPRSRTPSAQRIV